MGTGMGDSIWRTCLGVEEGLEEEEGTEGGGVGTRTGTDRCCTEYRTDAEGESVSSGSERSSSLLSARVHSDLTSREYMAFANP